MTVVDQYAGRFFSALKEHRAYLEDINEAWNDAGYCIDAPEGFPGYSKRIESFASCVSGSRALQMAVSSFR